LGYLVNIGRFVARHPTVDMLHGTTHNEAYHLDLKAFNRNVMKQTRRHAKVVAKCATAVKLIASVMGTAGCVRECRQVQRMTAFGNVLVDECLPINGVLTHRST
jgi:hypothetical protein